MEEKERKMELETCTFNGDLVRLHFVFFFFRAGPGVFPFLSLSTFSHFHTITNNNQLTARRIILAVSSSIAIHRTVSSHSQSARCIANASAV